MKAIKPSEGIPGPTDNEHPFLVVNIKKQTVHEEADDRSPQFTIELRDDSLKRVMSFEDFAVKFVDPELEPVIGEAIKAQSRNK